MPHEPTREAASARQLVEAASAFARREMLPEARQALHDARDALALRGDAGPAHWCDACLVALEIAVRGGDFPEMEAEAALLHSLSGGGRYWTQQARARIGEHAARFDPARLERVFAVLVGEDTPAAPRREPPPTSEAASSDDAHGPPPTSAEPPNVVITLPTPENDARDEPITASPEGLTGLGSDIPPAFAQETRVPRLWAASPPRRSRVQAGFWVVLALAVPLWASRSVVGVVAPLPGSSASAGERALGTGNPVRALQLANAVPSANEATPHKRFVLGQALLASGDTAGAVAAFTRAAQTDSRGTIAWNAAESLARLPGHSASAADAYLLAYAAGLPADRAEIVAHAQELAGRPDRAQRVREQSAVR